MRSLTLWCACSIGLVLGLGASCTSVSFLNATAPVGSGDIPLGVVINGQQGLRSPLSAVFINQTPFRATFTTGVFDPQNDRIINQNDPRDVLLFYQFFDSSDNTLRLNGNSTSETITFSCGREWSVGSARLIELLRYNGLTGGANETALTPGVQFFQDDLTDPTAEPALVGTAEPRSALLGVNYECDSLLVFRLREDAAAAGGFRIDLEVILP